MSEKVGKKILQVGYASFAKAGIQTVIMNIARGVHKDFDIDVLLTSNKPGYYDEEFEQYGNIYRVNCSVEGFGKLKKYLHFVIRPFKQFFYARKLMKKNQYDIVHIHSGLEGGPMFLAAKFAGVKHIVAHSHNTASPEKRSFFSRIYRALNKRIIHRTATIRIGVSKDANQYLYGKDECFIINNPVELERFLNAKREKHKDKIVLTNVGRYCYQKNQGFIIEILQELLTQGQDAELNLVGFGEDEKKLKQQIAECKLTDKVHMIRGDGDADIPAILGGTDVFVFPSRFEGLGIVIIEAQAAECLCVASDVVPVETDLGLCKYISLQESAETWADETIKMMEDPDKYQLDKDLLYTYHAKQIQDEFKMLYHKLSN